ncbi:MAG TPA: PEGA domain-containing protein [Polyangia bacterium]|nr:PEGA domain-containing protein [Polyangia bacterium]
MKIVGALLLAFLLAAAGCAHSLAASGVAFRVESNVPDASVWIDDVLVGQVSQWQRDGRFVRPGFHRVEIRHPSYFSVFQEIDFPPGARTTVQAHLQPLIQ